LRRPSGATSVYLEKPNVRCGYFKAVLKLSAVGRAGILSAILSSFTTSFVLAILSGFLLLLAFPTFDLGWLAWVGLVPLFIAISGRSAKSAFLLSYLCGMVFVSGVYRWVLEAPGYHLYHHAIAAVCFGLYFGLFGGIVNLLSRRLGAAWAHLAMPFGWVAMEFVKSNLFFLALPFPILAHSQYPYLKLIQITSLTGTYGLSFLIVLFNSALVALILRSIHGTVPHGEVSGVPSRRGTFDLVLLTVTLLGVVLFYGHLVLPQGPISGKSLAVSVVQGNIDREIKEDPRKHATFIMQKYSELTERASMDRPELIVWPEAATPGLVLKNVYILNQMVMIARRANTHFLIGSSEYPKFTTEKFDPKKIGNTALFFSPHGRVLGQYLKIRLIPFAEYIPYQGTIPWPEFIVSGNKKISDVPGQEYKLFDLDGTKFGTVICSECTFPDLFRRFVKKGAAFMVNITNEGWFGETALRQKVAASVFRAVENRIFLVRATNTGISCFIDPYGRITGRVQKDEKDTLVEGYLTRPVYLSVERTFYTRYGDLFPYLCLMVSVVMIGASWWRVKR
jgi:apolipoprotein N-acyltransferase